MVERRERMRNRRRRRRRRENRGGVQEGSGWFTGLYGGQVDREGGRKGDIEKKCLEDHWL